MQLALRAKITRKLNFSWRTNLSNDFQWSVIVAMPSMRVVQTAIHQIVRMVPVWHGLMSAFWPMNVFCIVSTGFMSASIRIGAVDFNGVLIHVIPMHVMKMAVV